MSLARIPLKQILHAACSMTKLRPAVRPMLHEWRTRQIRRPLLPKRRNLPVMASADTVSGVISSKSLRFSPGRDPHGGPPLIISKVT